MKFKIRFSLFLAVFGLACLIMFCRGELNGWVAVQLALGTVLGLAISDFLSWVIDRSAKRRCG